MLAISVPIGEVGAVIEVIIMPLSILGNGNAVWFGSPTNPNGLRGFVIYSQFQCTSKSVGTIRGWWRRL